MATTDTRNTRADPAIPGTPAHLAAVCREAALRVEAGMDREDRVRLFAPVLGFQVPADGLWTINGKAVAAGEVVDLPVGTILHYTVLAQPADPAAPPTAGAVGPHTRGFVRRAPRADPRTGELLSPAGLVLPRTPRSIPDFPTRKR